MSFEAHRQLAGGAERDTDERRRRQDQLRRSIEIDEAIEPALFGQRIDDVQQHRPARTPGPAAGRRASAASGRAVRRCGRRGCRCRAWAGGEQLMLGSSPGEPRPRWGGSDANGVIAEPSRTRKMVPTDHRCTSSPVVSNARPHATPRPVRDRFVRTVRLSRDDRVVEPADNVQQTVRPERHRRRVDDAGTNG